MRCPCGRWLPSGARDRTYCPDHSLDRKDRINRTLFNCAGGVPALTDFSYHFRSKYAELFSTYEEVDCTGCRIICLSLRPDTASIRSLSKILYSKGGCTDREAYVAWCLGVALGSCGVSSSHSHSASNRSSPGSASYRSPETCTSSRSRSSVASYRSPRRSSAACHGATPFQGLPPDARTTNGSRL